ncbi:MAG: ThuA domain-containing protein [Verrucomicrobiae bacterium]|nr:ThuA domain-containing protein [Verrucomicrobiae bacterium]
MLVTDLAVSPRGDLYLSGHGGLPDWGTGLTGQGWLLRIRYSDPDAPQPLETVAAHPEEVRIRFDRPVRPESIGVLAGLEIVHGEHVRAGDRWEILKPPYAAVNQQEATPKYRAKILTAALQGGEELVLTTTPHAGPGRGVVTLPLSGSGGAGEMTVEYRLTACELPPARPAQAVGGRRDLAFGEGDHERGRELFSKLQCAACHRLRGDGGGEGPDLDHLAAREASEILRDIVEPDATIHPDYVGYHLRIEGGDEFTGFVRHSGDDALRLIGVTGESRVVRSSSIRERRPASVSLMPSGLLDGLSAEGVADLLTYLRHMPPIRDRAEIASMIAMGGRKAAFLAADPEGVASPHGSSRPAHIVLVASRQDHGPGQHDYPRWQSRWSRLLELQLSSGHPLTVGLPDRIQLLDEPYWPLIGETESVQVLAAAAVDGAMRPLVWTFERGPGRVFASIPGHYSWTLDDPLFRVLVVRGIAWTARRPVSA